MIEKQTSQLEIRCRLLSRLFNDLMSTNSRVEKEAMVAKFRGKYQKMNSDLDFAFEVLAGKHKLGYTYGKVGDYGLSDISYQFNMYSIKKFVLNVLKSRGSTEFEIGEAYVSTPSACRTFIENLVNRRYKLGYSNQKAMVTSLSPMLAKKYPETFREGYYYVQEKLDGNRCIAVYIDAGEMSPEGIRSLKGATEGKWFFYSRSGKLLKVDFDMSWADINYAYDGEVMTLSKAGTRDFNRTNGAINSKYGDKSGLHYFIYDILVDDMTYEDRFEVLKNLRNAQTHRADSDCQVSPNVSLLPVLEKVWVNANPEYNSLLDKWLDYIVDKGGEGIILRDPDAVYEHKRCNGLLKYKKTQTCDLRIIGWNEGKGKYEGLIGSFICATDDGTLECSVAGMSDAIRMSNPDDWMGKIIEVAYFSKTKGNCNKQWSLRFPRFKKVREDKTETSLY